MKRMCPTLAVAVVSTFCGALCQPVATFAQDAQSLQVAESRWPPKPTQSYPAQPSVLFDNGNIQAVANQPTRTTTFTVTRPTRINAITDYHWNNALGARPGTIALFSLSGRIFGPWQASGSPGQGGVPNAYWTVRFSNFVLPPGRYVVVDSDIATWSQNSGTGGAGMVRIEGG